MVSDRTALALVRGPPLFGEGVRESPPPTAAERAQAIHQDAMAATREAFGDLQAALADTAERAAIYATLPTANPAVRDRCRRLADHIASEAQAIAQIGAFR